MLRIRTVARRDPGIRRLPLVQGPGPWRPCAPRGLDLLQQFTAALRLSPPCARNRNGRPKPRARLAGPRGRAGRPSRLPQSPRPNGSAIAMLRGRAGLTVTWHRRAGLYYLEEPQFLRHPFMGRQFFDPWAAQAGIALPRRSLRASGQSGDSTRLDASDVRGPPPAWLLISAVE